MSDDTLHLPKTFLLRDEVRTLGRLVPGGANCALRMWLDWSREGMALRAFRRDGGDTDPLVLLVEEWCEWKGAAGELIRLAGEAGVLKRHEPEGGKGGGLELVGFAEYNLHLSPHFVSPQVQGGRRRAAMKRLEQIGALVPKQLEMLGITGAIRALDSASESEKRRAVGFVMALDCAAGRDPRGEKAYAPDLLTAALGCVRAYDEEALGQVVLDLSLNREDPAASLDTDTIIRRLLDSAPRVV